jgi:hypothetical protein
MVALRAKMYALKMYTLNPSTQVYSESKRAKGVGKRARDSQLSLDDYKRCLEEYRQKIVNMTTLQSFKHKIYTLSSNKKATDPFEEKRMWVDTQRSLAYGHKDCKMYE